MEGLDVRVERLGKRNRFRPHATGTLEQTAILQSLDVVIVLEVRNRGIAAPKRPEVIFPRRWQLLDAENGEVAMGGQQPAEARHDHGPIHPMQAITGRDQGIGRVKRHIL